MAAVINGWKNSDTGKQLNYTENNAKQFLFFIYDTVRFVVVILTDSSTKDARNTLLRSFRCFLKIDIHRLIVNSSDRSTVKRYKRNTVLLIIMIMKVF